LSALACVFDPSKYPQIDTAIRLHGVAEMHTICKQFGVDKQANTSSPALADAVDAEDEEPDGVDPWDDPDFKLPDVDDDAVMEAEPAARDGKDSKATHAVKALVNEDECLGELYSFRNWVLNTNSAHLKAQQQHALKQSDSDSLLAAQRQDKLNNANSVKKRAAGKMHDNPREVEAKDEAVDSKAAAAVPAKPTLRNLTMNEIILLFINDPSSERSFPNIFRFVAVQSCLTFAQVSVHRVGFARRHSVLRTRLLASLNVIAFVAVLVTRDLSH
jgi:hypothetical protein